MVAAVVAAGLLIGFALDARADAQERCEASMPHFPARVLGVEVDWRLRDVAYECVYRMYPHRQPWRLPPCPEGQERPAALPRCVTPR